MDTRRGYTSRGGRSETKASSNLTSDEEKVSKQKEALQATLAQISRNFGGDAVMWLGKGNEIKSIPVISTGSLALDAALGVGGLPKGRIVEIYGPEASGKTTLTLHVIAEAQKNGGYCVFIDAEHALDTSLAEALGVQAKNLLVAKPDSGEEALNLVDQSIRSGLVDVVVVDSTRLKLGTHGYGGTAEVTSGGNALKFYSSVRLNVCKTGQLKNGEQVIGSSTLVKVVKNKLAPPFKTAEFEIEFGKGISREGEILDQALKHGLVCKSGNWHICEDERMGNGRENAKNYLREHVELRETLFTRIKERLVGDGKEHPLDITTD